MRLNLLAHPLLARVVIDVTPEYTRRVYVSKFGATSQQDVAKLVEAVILGAMELAQRYGIQITGVQVTPPAPGGSHGQAQQAG